MLRAFPILRLPLFWGGLLFLAFYALIDQGVLGGGFVQRYFASHPVEYLAASLFFVGLSALGIKVLGLFVQRLNLSRVTLGPIPPEGQSALEADTLLAGLGRFPDAWQEGYLPARLRDALQFVRRRGSADALLPHLRHLAEADAERMHISYALVRIIVWAIPILGFLGTVIGITLAVAKLSPEALEQSLPEVTTGLGVAFDTTALALGLSIVLMFAKFFVERMELGLLESVDRRTTDELVGRFHEPGTNTDPQIAYMQRLTERVIHACEQLVKRQTKLWKSTVDDAQQRWNQWSTRAGEDIQQALAHAVARSLEQHAERLVEAEESLAARSQAHLAQLAGSLEQSVKGSVQLQAELVRQGEVLRQIVGATAHLNQLESALNKNLAALSGARNFEETVTSLAAAIQLLSSRLGQSEPLAVRLPAHDAKTHAA